MDRKKTFPGLILFMSAVFVMVVLNLEVAAQANQETKSEKMLKEIEAIYKPFDGKSSFIVSYIGKEKKEIDVITVEVGSAVALIADVAAGREINLTPEVMRKLLEFNSRADFIKVGISDIGSIRVHSEQKLALLNAKTFEEILDQVAAGADEVATMLKPVRKPR